MAISSPLSDQAARVDPGAVDELAATLRGPLIRPGDSGYVQHRKVWNGSIDRRPALIARCTGRADVASAVRFARRHGIVIAVRGGGHSFPGYSVCDGGLVVDLSPMKEIRVDPEARTVRVQAGVLLGELDRETQQLGLAVPAGIVSHTGVAGLTLGGGMGWLTRKYGLTIDQLRSVDIVTADGGYATASPTENADLFWGVRGGGGNFGIVTAFEFRLSPLDPIVLAGPLYWPMAQSPLLLRFYREWIAEAPDELMTLVVHRKAPALPAVPRELHGQPVVSVVACYAGDPDDGERVLRPLRQFGSPVLDLCRPQLFVDHQAMFDPGFPAGWWYYMRACDVAELSDAVIDITADQASQISSPLTSFPIWHFGGAMSRVGDDETVFDGRTAKFAFNISAATATEVGFAEERDWVRRFWDALRPFHTGVYVNFLMDEGEQRIRQAYGTSKFDRLQRLKTTWDPDNVFRLNQNIPPR